MGKLQQDFLNYLQASDGEMLSALAPRYFNSKSPEYSNSELLGCDRKFSYDLDILLYIQCQVLLKRVRNTMDILLRGRTTWLSIKSKHVS